MPQPVYKIIFQDIGVKSHSNSSEDSKRKGSLRTGLFSKDT